MMAREAAEPVVVAAPVTWVAAEEAMDIMAMAVREIAGIRAAEVPAVAEVAAEVAAIECQFQPLLFRVPQR